MPKPLWVDDFFGIALSPQYNPIPLPGATGGPTGTGSISMASSPALDGSVVLGTTATGAGNARLRFGEEPGTGPVDVRNWAVSHNIVHEARVFLNLNTYVQATVGFVGNPDPVEVLAAIYNAAGNSSGDWIFQIATSGQPTQNIHTGFTHTPGTWATFSIVTTAGSPATATLYVNGVSVATYTGASIPMGGFAHEFQLWNKPQGSAYSQASMWIDYLYLTQDR